MTKLSNISLPYISFHHIHTNLPQATGILTVAHGYKRCLPGTPIVSPSRIESLNVHKLRARSLGGMGGNDEAEDDGAKLLRSSEPRSGDVLPNRMSVLKKQFAALTRWVVPALQPTWRTRLAVGLATPKAAPQLLQRWRLLHCLLYCPSVAYMCVSHTHSYSQSAVGQRRGVCVRGGGCVLTVGLLRQAHGT